MKIDNVHRREINLSEAEIGPLIDTLGSENDKLWPGENWPSIKFGSPLAAGAIGGHGPIRYTVESYEPSQRVRFRFQSPSGFDGFHQFEVQKASSGRSTLEHKVEMNLRGWAIFSWNIVYGPLHDALIEDCFSRAQESLNQNAQRIQWSLWVKSLRWVLKIGKSKSRK